MNNYDDIMILIDQQSEMALAAFELADVHRKRVRHWRRWALGFAVLAAVEFVVLVSITILR